tara:strand:- start:894 stop:1157 length:264 start_codon:yes stop_codon:yes gene_type:complete
MVNNRLFQISSPIFNGYNVNIDLDEYDNINVIVNYVKEQLYLYLKNGNFDVLCDKVNNTMFHIHDVTYENMLMSDVSSIFYICECQI